MIRKICLMVVSLVILSAMFAGCSSSDFEARHDAEDSVREIWGVGENDIKGDVIGGISGSWSESHRMMAIMILSGAGMDTDFKSYDEVFLVDVKTNDGSNTARVVVVEKDGKRETIVPQAIKDQGTIGQ